MEKSTKIFFSSPPNYKNSIIENKRNEYSIFRKNFLEMLYLFDCLDIVFRILEKNFKIKKKKEDYFSEKKKLNFFLTSFTNVLSDIIFKWKLLNKVDLTVYTLKKFLCNFPLFFEKFFENKKGLLFEKNNLVSKKGKMNRNSLLLNKDFKKTMQIKDSSQKKKFLYQKDITYIKYFISDKLVKLNSILDVNITNQLEMIEQVSDHSVFTESDLIKTKAKIKSIENMKKKFNVIGAKTISCTFVSFFTCIFLFK